MQFQRPQNTQWKIAIAISILIIALVSDVSCIRNSYGTGDTSSDVGSEKNTISVKLKNFFPSEPVNEVSEVDARQYFGATHDSAVAGNRDGSDGFRPSQMLEFTPADASLSKRFPPSYLEPNYKYTLVQPGESITPQLAMDKQSFFPEDGQPPSSVYHSYHSSTALPTTPVVSYLDPYTKQNYGYMPTTPTSLYGNDIQYQREQPAQQDDQVYTVQSSLLVGSQQQQLPHQKPGIVEDVYLKRPGYVFDERPHHVTTTPLYRRPTATVPTAAPSANKISYDSHDYPPPSYAAQQTSNFVPQRPRRPPPSRLPAYNQHHRQDINDNRPLAAAQHPLTSPLASANAPSSSSSNYANNFGNYLQRPPPSYSGFQQQPHTQSYQQQQQPPQRPNYPPPGPNYYEYQIGEIPPQSHSQKPQYQQQQQQQQLNYRPGLNAVPAYRPPTQSTVESETGGGNSGGLATLASLFTSTQQYAPQFTNLLLGGGGGGAEGASSSHSSASANSPFGNLLGVFTGAIQQPNHHQQHARPPNTQLIRALENIARNDDLQCVPKVLCQMIAGQTLRGQLPSFITSPAITNFLAGFPAASPALIYGRAALLAISGGDRSCVRTYEKCPKNEMEIIHYLNNHRGGFFKFFSEPEDQSAAVQQSESAGGGLFGIISALTGGGSGGSTGQVSYTTRRPTSKPRPTQAPSAGIADGIGNFFTRVLSEYLNGVEYQRRRRRSLQPAEIKRDIEPDNGGLMPVDFHDEEDDLDTQSFVKFQDDDEVEAALAHTELIGVLQFPQDESRILHYKDIASDGQQQHTIDGVSVRFPDATDSEQHKVIYDFNRDAAKRKLRFPKEKEQKSEPSKRLAKQVEFSEAWHAMAPYMLTEEEYGSDRRRGKRIVFKDTNEQLDDAGSEANFRELEQEEQQQQQHQHTNPPNAIYEQAAPPQRGARIIFPDHYERYIRRGKILNRPTYAPNYDYQGHEDDRQQRPGAHYRLETDTEDSYQHMNRGEYLAASSNVRFEDPSEHYNYPNSNYISDNRYSSAYQAMSTPRPKNEDDQNIYVNNAHGITEYYIRPDGRKVYLPSG